MDADQERRRRRKVLPALDLHPEPVVHQRVPEVLLLFEEVPVRTVERPLRRPGGDPSRRPCLLLATFFRLFPRVPGSLSSLRGSVASALPWILTLLPRRRCHRVLPTVFSAFLEAYPDRMEQTVL